MLCIVIPECDLDLHGDIFHGQALVKKIFKKNKRQAFTPTSSSLVCFSLQQSQISLFRYSVFVSFIKVFGIKVTLSVW